MSKKRASTRFFDIEFLDVSIFEFVVRRVALNERALAEGCGGLVKEKSFNETLRRAKIDPESDIKFNETLRGRFLDPL